MITKLRQPKFQIGDRVRLSAANAKSHFVISGIVHSGAGTYHYCHDDVAAGWMAENQLEFYLTPDEEARCQEIEHILHKIETITEDLGEKAIGLDDMMDGIPRQIQVEMDRVSRLVSRRFRS